MRYLILLSALLCVASSPALATNAHISVSHVGGLYGPSALPADGAQQVTFFIHFNNDGIENMKGPSNGFQVFSPDGVSWTTMTYRQLPTIDWNANFMFFFPVPKSISGSGADTVGFGGVASGQDVQPGIPGMFNDTVYALTVGPLSPADHGKVICIDSCYYPTSGTWKWGGGVVDSILVGDRFPTWSGPHCYTLIDAAGGQCLVPDPLVIKLETEEGNDPTGVTLDVDVFDTGDPLGFTLTKNQSWLDLSASIGATPASITVSASVAGLTPGEYWDTITVTAAGASNSPMNVQVVLNVEKVLDAMPFWGFEMYATDGNQAPDDTLIVVARDGISQVPFDASTSEDWVTLIPSSGTTPQTLVVKSDGRSLAPSSAKVYVCNIILTPSAMSVQPLIVPYGLRVVDQVTGVHERDGINLPGDFHLAQNYPNPFNPTTQVAFDLPVRTHVTLTVYNVMGQQVRTLVDEPLSAGSYETDWDGHSSSGAEVASGVYFYRLHTEQFTQTKKMVLLK